MDAEDEDDSDLQLEKLYNRWDAFCPGISQVVCGGSSQLLSHMHDRSCA